MSASAKFDMLAIQAFVHLLQHHPEHVDAACQPMMGKVANYVASLAFQSNDEEYGLAQSGARSQIGDLLDRLTWSEALKRFCFDLPSVISKSVQSSGEISR
jgi:hypothetical protein